MWRGPPRTPGPPRGLRALAWSPVRNPATGPRELWTGSCNRIVRVVTGAVGLSHLVAPAVGPSQPELIDVPEESPRYPFITVKTSPPTAPGRRRLPLTGAIVAVILLCGILPIAAQDRALRFNNVDIHESAPDERGRAEFLPSGTFTASRQTIEQLIARAYDIREYQVADVPDALADARFDIEADAPETASAVDGPQMLRRLLADRFGLVVRDETRQQPAYALARDGRKLGRRLKEATARCTPMPGMPEATREPSNGANECRSSFGWVNDGIFIRQSRIATLVRLLETELGTVIDRTGLTGKYDVDLMSPGIGPGPKPATRAPRDPLFEAVRSQLGLKLEPTSVDLSVVKVVAVRRP
jgi:uncharacterized protein (TIGR03435 family)